jgi:hypothetical protein
MIYRKFNTYTTQSITQLSDVVFWYGNNLGGLRRLSQAVGDNIFLNEESAHLNCGLNSDRGGHFSRQQLLEIGSCFRQPSP